jgi:beta-glucosidase-like glycosyl hydrolase
MPDESANAPYRDPRCSIENRVHDLLARMTPREKLAQLYAIWVELDADGVPAPYQGVFANPAALDLEEATRFGLGQLTRPFGSRPVDPVAGARALNSFQRRLVEETRLGIPAIAHEEALTGFMAQGATQFPSPLNFGATWDPALIERVGDVIRRQMRAVGAHQALAPVADVIRDPRWGRVEECVSEDPYLVGCTVTAFVRGLQGPDLSEGVAATLKHFAGYSFSEGGRNFAPVHVGPRELADVFLLPFEMAVKDGRAQSVMNAYHDIDGTPCASSHELLTGVLRERWGFEGVVVADYGAVAMLQSLHHTCSDERSAARAALCAGLDVELPTPSCFLEGVPAALADGSLDPSIVDRAVERVLALKFRLGLFERPYVDVAAIEPERASDRELAQTVAEKSITLLSNDGTLPLAADVRSVAVIGPSSDDALALFGNYSFHNHVASHFDAPPPAGVVTLLDAVRGRLGPERVAHARGCWITRRQRDRELGRPPSDGPVVCDDRSAISAAVTAARAAEVALVVIGDRAGHFGSGTVGEGTDTADLGLPGVQHELAAAVIATGTPTVLVLLNGRPMALGELATGAAAILEAWFPGQQGADAISRVLFGDVNPGGKTTVSFSQGAGVQPAYYNHKALASGIPRSAEFEPVFPFGHGLSYTTFEYSDLEIGSGRVAVDAALSIRCRLRNSGDVAGEEVVQLYLRDELGSVTRPVCELKGFRRVALQPSEACSLEFRLSADLLSFSAADGHRIVEPGFFKVMLGASSRDIRLEGRFELTGATRELAEDREMFCPVEVGE